MLIFLKRISRYLLRRVRRNLYCYYFKSKDSYIITVGDDFFFVPKYCSKMWQRFSRESRYLIVDDVGILVLPREFHWSRITSTSHINSVKLDYDAARETGANVTFGNAVIARESSPLKRFRKAGEIFTERAFEFHQRDATKARPPRSSDPIVAVIAARWRTSRFRNIELVEGIWNDDETETRPDPLTRRVVSKNLA